MIKDLDPALINTVTEMMREGVEDIQNKAHKWISMNLGAGEFVDSNALASHLGEPADVVRASLIGAPTFTIKHDGNGCLCISLSSLISESVSDSPAEAQARLDLQKNYASDDIYNTTELQNFFTVIGFAAPMVVVTRKADGKKGSLEFRSNPRLYFHFIAD